MQKQNYSTNSFGKQPDCSKPGSILPGGGSFNTRLKPELASQGIYPVNLRSDATRETGTPE